MVDYYMVDVPNLDEAGAASLAESAEALGFETIIASPEKWFYWFLDRRSARAVADLLRWGVEAAEWDRGPARRLQIEGGIIDDFDDWLKRSRQSAFELPGKPVGGHRDGCWVITPLGLTETGARQLVERAAGMGFTAVALDPDEWWISGFSSVADLDRALLLGLASAESVNLPRDLREMAGALAALMSAWQETIDTSDWD